MTGADASRLDADRPGVIAAFETDDGPWYVVTEEPGGYRISFWDCGEFAISDDLSLVTVTSYADGSSHLLPILFAGTVLALILTLRGELVLHASAVATNGRVTGFIAESGRGKTTLAALAVAGGAQFVTDDVLLVDCGRDEGVACRGAGSELRLRPKARELAALFDGAAQHETADGRLAVLPSRTLLDWVPLDLLILPSPVRGIDRVELIPMTSAEALFELLSVPRVETLRAPWLIQRQFELTGVLVQRVPLYEARIPWGPPFSPDVVDELLATVP